MEKNFEQSSPDSQQEFFANLQGGDSVRMQASPQIATSIAQTSDGHVNVFFANFAGLVGGTNPMQTPQTWESRSRRNPGAQGFFLPFLGEVQAVKGVRSGDAVTFTLPAITKGAVFWYEQ